MLLQETAEIDTFDDNDEFNDKLATMLCANRMDTSVEPPQCGDGTGARCYNFFCAEDDDEEIEVLHQGSETLYLALKAQAATVSAMWRSMSAANAAIGDIKFGTKGRIEMTFVDGKPTLLYTQQAQTTA